jgi:hypothetical protein
MPVAAQWQMPVLSCVLSFDRCPAGGTMHVA